MQAFFAGVIASDEGLSNPGLQASFPERFRQSFSVGFLEDSRVARQSTFGDDACTRHIAAFRVLPPRESLLPIGGQGEVVPAPSVDELLP